MTKSDIIEQVSKKADLNRKDTEKLVEIVFNSIIEALNNGDKVELRGFGSFRTRQRKSRRGRNPKTGQTVEVPTKQVAYFKPGKELRELINKQ